jgi:hypothetical protein
MGLDMTKALPVLYQGGVTIEPFFIYTGKDSTISFVGTLGYSDIRINRIYNNITYFNKGLYGKVGADYHFTENWDMGINLVYSKFDELGRTTFTGDYYEEDWQVEFVQKQNIFGIEHHTDFWYPIGNHFFINPQFRISMLLSNTSEPFFGTYFAPGFGLVQLLDGGAATKTHSSWITGGFSIRIVYKF